MEKIKSKNQRSLKKIILSGAAIILLLIVWLIFIANNNLLDQNILQYFSDQTTTQGTAILKAVTFLGNHKFFIPANLILVFLLFSQKKMQDAFRVAFIASSSFILLTLLKNLFQRQRPPSPLVDGITNFSFPSGHAFMSITFYGLIIYFLVRNNNKNLKKEILVILLIVLIIIIGLSRIYLRVHYPSDVIAGWIIGTFWLLICLEIINSLIRKKTTSYN